MSQQLKFNLYEQELLEPLHGHDLSEVERYVASLLLDATADRPVGISQIIGSYQYKFNKSISDRSIKDVIRTLRREHLLSDSFSAQTAERLLVVCFLR